MTKWPSPSETPREPERAPELCTSDAPGRNRTGRRLCQRGPMEVVEPTEEQLEVVAGLRFDWALAGGHRPAESREEFVAGFVGWVAEHRGSHACRVVVDGGEVVGFGFLAVTPRVPAPGRPDRLSGDVQAVFVVPGRRNAGIGVDLVRHLVAEGRRRGVEHLTVHSSPGAVTAYERAGFRLDRRLLFLDTPATPD